MYENIRKPGWLRYTPALLIRSLPAVYYYARYTTTRLPEEPENYYRMQLRYLEKSLAALGRILKIDEFNRLSGQAVALLSASNQKRLEATETFTIGMTACCNKWRTLLQENRSNWTSQIQQIYQEEVFPLHLILVDYQKNPVRIEKLHRLLTNSCYYKVDCISGIDDTFQMQILSAACIIFTDIQPSGLHQDYERIKSYRKPVVAIIPREERQGLQQTAIRHAGQLARLGLDILIHYITPIRLYTTIEKNYIHYFAHHT